MNGKLSSLLSPASVSVSPIDSPGKERTVFITGRRLAELERAITAIGSSARALQGDVSDLADLDRIFAHIQAEAGRIDVPAANAMHSQSSQRSPRSTTTRFSIPMCVACSSPCRRPCRC